MKLLRMALQFSLVFCFGVSANFARGADVSPQYESLGESDVLGVFEARPLWEEARPGEGKDWTDHTASLIKKYGAALFPETKDMGSFCPRYAKLSEQQRLSFWIFMVSAIVKYESYFNPLDRYVEQGLGIDPITGKPVVSEGLLQLSYQDELQFPYCNQFDWKSDRKLAETDPQRTILDPEKNLSCGVRILIEQVARNSSIAGKGYWATLDPANKHSRVANMRRLTNQISFCQ